jgi:hypothetical protein
MKAKDTRVDEKWFHLLNMLPQGLDASARLNGAVERFREVRSGADLIRLILVYALSDLSLKDVAAWAASEGIAKLSAPALFYRLTQSEQWLESLVADVLSRQAEPPATGFAIRVVDASVITGPGSKGTDWRAHVVMDPVSARIRSVELTDAKGAESYVRHAVRPGEVVLGDRAYATARSIASMVERQAHPVVRVNPQGLKVCNLQKQKIKLLSYEQGISKHTMISLDVLIPVPPDMKGRRRKDWDLDEATSWITARIVGTRTPKGTVVWVLTTLSVEELSDKDCLGLYRLRWQIELLFKRLKSLLHLDALPTRDGPTARVWLLARFLAAALAQDLVRPSGVFSPRGSARAGLAPLPERLVAIPGKPVDSEIGGTRGRVLASCNQ